MIIRLAAAAAAGAIAVASGAALAASSAPPAGGNANATSQASPFTGAVTVQQGGGQGEAVLLSANEIIQSANETFSDPSVIDAQDVVIFPGKDAPDFTDWLELRGRMQVVKRALVAALPKKEPQPEFHMAESLAGFTQVASYFATDYQFGSETVSPDDFLYAVAAAHALKNAGRSVTLANQVMTVSALNGVMDCNGSETGTLKPDSKKMETCFAELDYYYGAVKAGATTPPTPAQKSAMAAYEGLLAALAPPAKSQQAPAGGGDSGAPANPQASISLSKAIAEKAILERIGDKGRGLFLKVNAATGGYYSRRSLWTLLGIDGLPISVSGGAVLSWVLVDNRGEVQDAEVVPLYSKYRDPYAIKRRVDETRRKNRSSPRFDCRPSDPDSPKGFAAGYVCTPRR